MNTSKDMDQIISSRLKGKLAEKKIKNYQIAEDLSIADMTVSGKLNGKQPITVGQFSYICAKYDFSNTEIFEILNAARNSL